MKILVTAGGTAEPIDGVRQLTNTSSGKTGVAIAEFLSRQNCQVDLLLSSTSTCQPTISYSTFTTHSDLESAMRTTCLKKPDWVIHTAAVSDYLVKSIKLNAKTINNNTKIPSGQNLTIELKPSTKIIDQVSEWNPEGKLFGFKFTKTKSSEERLSAVKTLMERSKADFVLWNDANEKNDQTHFFRIYDSEMHCHSEGEFTEEIPRRIWEAIKEKV